MFFNRASHHGAITGVHLQLGADGEPVQLFIQLFIHTGDGLADAEFWCHRGPTATKFCMECQAAVDGTSKPGTPGLHLYSAYYKPHWSDNPAEWDRHDDASVRGCYMRLLEQSTRMNATRFRNAQQHQGFTFSVNSVLLEPDLLDVVRPIANHQSDYMHGMANNGWFNFEAHRFFSTLEECPQFKISDVQSFITTYQLPKNFAQSKDYLKVFTPSNWAASKAKEELRCYASDVLSLYPILARFVCVFVIPLGIARDACTSFLLLCDFLDMLKSVPHGRITGAMLRQKGLDHHKAYMVAYDHIGFLRKGHHKMHYGDFLDRHGILVSCWTLERFHKHSKNAASLQENTSCDWERSVLSLSLIHI